jgi:hypothetical protein
MKVERILRDIHESVRNILRALDSGLTAEDNFGVTRAPAGSVLTSVDPAKKPEWRALGDVTDGGGGTEVLGHTHTVTWSQILNKPTTLTGFGLRAEVLSMIESALDRIVTDNGNVVVDSGTGRVVYLEE